MPIVILLVIAAAAYVVYKRAAVDPDAPDDFDPSTRTRIGEGIPSSSVDRSIGIHRAPVDFHRETTTTSTTGLRGTVTTGGRDTGEGIPLSDGAHMNIARAMMNPALRAIEYVPAASGVSATPFTPLPGDIEIVVADRERRGRTRPILLSSQPRGERVNSLFDHDPMRGTSGDRLSMDIQGVGGTSWERGDPIPEILSGVPSYINPGHYRLAELKQVEFMMDIAEALAIEKVEQIYILGESNMLMRLEQAVTRDRTIWRTLLSRSIPLVLSVLSSVGGQAIGSAVGSATSTVITGFINRGLTIVMDLATRRNKLETFIGNMLSTISASDLISGTTEILGANNRFALEVTSVAPTLNYNTRIMNSFVDGLNPVQREAAMRGIGSTSIPALDSAGMLQGLNAEKYIAAAISNTDTRARSYIDGLGTRGAPYRVRKIVVYT